MIAKLKQKIFEGVVVSKVIKKGATWLAGGAVALLFAPKAAPIVEPILSAMDLSKEKLETGLTLAALSALGAGWNYVKHRFLVKK